MEKKELSDKKNQKRTSEKIKKKYFQKMIV